MKTQNKKRNSWRTIISFTCIMAILSLTLAFTSTAAEATGTYDFEVIGATSDFYVNDFAGLFTKQQKDDMMELAVAMDEEYGGIQVVVTTVESLADCTTDGSAHGIFETSYVMYNQYEIGEDSMGILILFSVGDRKIWMQTGHKMQAYITDGRSGELQDEYAMDYFRNDQFADGLISLQEGTISEIKSRVPQDWNAPVVTSESEEKTENAAVAANANATKTNNDSNKKSGGIGGWLYAIFAAFIAMIAGLIATIKGLFSSKSKASKQKESYEQKIASLQKSAESNTREAIEANSQTWRQTVEQQKRSYESKLSELKGRIESQNANIQNLQQELSKTQEELDEYEEKYTRIKALHPNVDFDKEVYEMRENEFKESAHRVDGKIAHYADLSADKDNIGVFSEAILTYDATISDVQKYMTTDIQKLRRLYEESVSLKKEYERAEKEKRDRAAAQKAFESISSICCGISHGNHENYEALKQAYTIYSELSSDEKGYFPDMQQIHNLESLCRTAEADMRDFNKAREAEKEVRSIVDRIYTADEDDRDKLERVMRCYRSLNSSQQKYFDDGLLRKLKTYIDDAESDHRKREAERRRKREEERRRREREEEERRRRMSSSSSFSSGSSHSHSGHGGRASGGGAGRSF